MNENYSHHKDKLPSRRQFKEESTSVLKEEQRHFDYSFVIVAKDCIGKLTDAIRTMRWNDNPNSIPLQDIFGYDIVNKGELIAQYDEVWHVGRFAVSKGCKEQLTLFRLLMVYAISPLFLNNSNGILLAEVDAKLLRVMRLMKIKAETLSEGIEYLGSTTIPAIMTKEGLQEFYFENVSLCPYLSDKKNQVIEMRNNWIQRIA